MRLRRPLIFAPNRAAVEPAPLRFPDTAERGRCPFCGSDVVWDRVSRKTWHEIPECYGWAQFCASNKADRGGFEVVVGAEDLPQLRR